VAVTEALSAAISGAASDVATIHGAGRFLPMCMMWPQRDLQTRVA